MNRRNFLWTLFSAPLALVLGVGRAVAAAVVMVPLQDPTAVALGYVEKAKDAPSAVRTNPKAFCSNCLQYQVELGDKAKKIAPCVLFQGKYVTAGGWCRSWFADPKKS